MPMTRIATASTDLLVGIGAGLVASWAMNLCQQAWVRISEEPEPKETAASKAADALSKQASGAPIKSTAKKSADTVLHYATGAIIGGAYGVIGGHFRNGFSGLMKKGQYREPGIPVGGGVRVAPGAGGVGVGVGRPSPEVGGVNYIDVESWQPAAGNCPS